MARSDPDSQQEIDGRLEYVRGLLEGGELTDDERRDRALSRLADLVSDLAAEVRDLRAELGDVRVRGNGAAQMETLYCPACGRQIELDPASLGPGPTDVVCVHCRAVLEVE